MSTATSTDELTELLEAWDHTPQCDHSQHDEKPEMHAGDAEWEVTHKCRECGHVGKGLRCSKWREWILTVRGGQVHCNQCDTYQTAYDYYRNSVWRPL